MEKRRTIPGTVWHSGLLILLFIFLTSKAYSFSWRSLRVIPEKEYCFTGETCVFTLEVPGLLPPRVDTTVQSTPDGVAIVSTVKEEYVENGERGTRVKLTFKFTKSGTFKIPSLAARIDWGWFNIPFLPITVYENPLLLMPSIKAEVPKSMKLGETYTFTVYGKFFSEINLVGSELDTHFILDQKEILLDLPHATGGFSTESLPISVFSITPVEVGTFDFPEIYVTGRSYSGKTLKILLEKRKIKIMAPDKQVAAEADQIIKKDETGEIRALPLIKPQISEENLEKIVQLALAKEKNRKTSLKICFFCSIGLFVIFTILLIFGIRGKKKKLILIFSILSFIFIGMTIFLSVCLSKQYGIAYNCDVHTVPEETSNKVMNLTAGTRIQIVETSSSWYCIELKDKRMGWILKSDCKLIDKKETENE